MTEFTIQIESAAHVQSFDTAAHDQWAANHLAFQVKAAFPAHSVTLLHEESNGRFTVSRF